MAAAVRFAGAEGAWTADTVTIVEAVAVPAEFVAVRTYVVVVVGDKGSELADTRPTVLTDTVGDGVPETDQDRLADCPARMVAGVAVKELIFGAWTAATVTVALAVALPALLVAVRV